MAGVEGREETEGGREKKKFPCSPCYGVVLVVERTNNSTRSAKTARIAPVKPVRNGHLGGSMDGFAGFWIVAASSLVPLADVLPTRARLAIDFRPSPGLFPILPSIFLFGHRTRATLRFRPLGRLLAHLLPSGPPPSNVGDEDGFDGLAYGSVHFAASRLTLHILPPHILHAHAHTHT